MSWLYRHWSLPEAVLALEHAERRAHAQLGLALSGHQLAGASLWAKNAGKAFEEFCGMLAERARGRLPRPKAKAASAADLISALSALGIPRAAAA